MKATLKKLSSEISGFSDWLNIPDQVQKSLKDQGFVPVKKPRELLDFPKELGDLGAQHVTKLMAHYSSWAAYSRSLFGIVISRKTVLIEIRKRLFVKIAFRYKDAKSISMSEAEKRALGDKQVRAIDKYILSDTTEARILEENLITYDKYVSVLSRELTRIGQEMAMTGDRDIYAGR